jgi:hypothetical protein
MYSLMGRILHTSQREKNIEIHIILQISLWKLSFYDKIATILLI